ncbi:MAG: sigma-70 family RNA polymerase sigma factor [Propionibacteriales bacterium]|nr:sigma-70 family RNA polymerase sigma factor [Propionibacteriales bacterium]
MPRAHAEPAGYDTLRCAVAELVLGGRYLATARAETGPPGAGGSSPERPADDADSARLAALVDLARGGDAEAFGLLYDHYHGAIFRFIYHRVSSRALAEDLLSETFFRALRSMASFQWQGRDFGAWLMTIARNLVVDHYKAGRTRLETTTDNFDGNEGVTDGPEDEVIAGLTNDILHEALKTLPTEQQECLVLRFLSGQSIAETARALGRSDGAVKQLQLRAIRNLAKLMPEGLR